MKDPKVAKTQTKVAKAFQLTLNDVAMFGEVRDYLLSLSYRYILAGKEKAPSTGHEHIHIYVQFEGPRRLSIKKLKGSHVEKCRGSPQQNINYIRKPDTEIIYEKGEPALKGGYTIDEVKKMAKEDREHLPLVYANIVSKINNEESKMIKGSQFYKGKIKVIWCHGESGSGKTRYAVQQIGDRTFNEVKFDGNFWHGVTEQCEVCLYDDWRDTHMKPVELINFIDYNCHIMNVKGGSVRNQYKEIYITSIQDPEKIYSNMPEEYKKQWLRRIKEIIKFELVNN